MKKMSVETDLVKELENYRKKCLELEEKSKKDEIRCLMLEIEVEDLKKKNLELEGEITKIRSNVEKGKGLIVDLTDEENEEDKFLQLMIENKVLECELKKAETELCSSKEKVKELESRVCELDNVLISKQDINHKTTIEKGNKYCSRIRKRLPFEEIFIPNKKMAPSTPGFSQPPFSGFIDISEEDEDYSQISKAKNLTNSRNFSSLANKSQCSSKNDPENTNLEHIEDEDVEGYSRYSPLSPNTSNRRRTSNIITSDDEKSNDDEDMDHFLSRSSNTPNTKRKRAANVITSDDESSYDDNAPISTLRKRHNSRLKTDSEDVEQNLKRLRKPGLRKRQDTKTLDDNTTVNLHGNSTSEDEEDEDDVEVGSESESEGLSGFIVESSDDNDSSYENSDSISSDESEDGLNVYKLTLDKIRRKKYLKQKWDLEGEMLADFGKDPELCMRAVCALYRQQTADEKVAKGTIHRNDRGFSHCDAYRASKVAEFLVDGDCEGDMTKTVEELEEYDSKGVKLCMTLAAKYSKQLFEIYKNKEDPYFLP